MAKTNKITNAIALNVVANVLNNADADTMALFTAELETVGFEFTELAEKLAHMASVETAKRANRSNAAPSAAQRELAQMVEQARTAINALDAGEVFGTQFIMEKVPFVNTPQKASAILKKLLASGFIVKAEAVRGRARYVKA